jgi:integrase
MPTITFDSYVEARNLPPCPDDSKSPYAWHKHASQAGFYIRASKRDKAGKFELVYFHRFKASEPDSDGGMKLREYRISLGVVQPKAKEEYEAALEKILKKRKELTRDESGSVSPRLTVAGAWAFHASVKQKSKDVTLGKDDEQYQRYFAHLGGRYLDELDGKFWTQVVTEMREGTYVVGHKPRADGRGMAPVMLGPLKASTLRGALNTGTILYDVANRFGGLRGDLKGKNPPREAKSLLGRDNKRRTRVPLALVGKAWRASDQLISPWWRDLFRIFVVTGMRFSLLMYMRFDEIDYANGIYVIDPRKRGTKRKGANITEDTPMIWMPLSGYVMNIIKARREFAPDPNGLVWFTPKPTRGRRTKKDAASLSDPRGAWSLIAQAIGMRFTPHDLRRTFASAGAMSGADMFGIAMLLLHTGDELAKAAHVPGITIDYIDTQEAVDRQRASAEAVTKYILRLSKLSDAEAAKIKEPDLPPELKVVLGANEAAEWDYEFDAYDDEEEDDETV